MMQDLIVDSFAGGGGASLAMEQALGRSPDIAINHDEEAIAMHAANHPATKHFASNIWRIDPLDATGGRPVGVAWFSPDCKHFSKAKGGKPVERRIRDLAWVVVMWAKRVRPRVIFLENVEEFADWGPLLEDGMPCPDRRGFTFRRWVNELRKLGYKVDWRELKACDYGAPTIRKRLFLIARCDGEPIVWPAPTHGPGLIPYRTAAEIIDWSLPCPSIFLTREEGRALRVNRPLADATMARIAKGVKRYVLDAAHPFIIPVTHAGDSRVHDIDEPLRTVTTAHRGEHAVVAPFLAPRYLAKEGHEPRTRSVEEPITTITPGGNVGVLAAPYLVPRYGERPGQEPRTRPVTEPMATVVPTANGGSLAAIYLAKQNFGDKPHHGADEPMHTVTTQHNKFGVVAAFLAQHNGGMVGHDARKPVSTIVQRGTTQAIVAAHMLSLHGDDRRMAPADAPVPTITAGGWHLAEVRAFLMKYYGTGAVGQDPRDPLHTVRTRDNLAVVMVNGEPYEIADIGMRMLSPRELFRAQGFPDTYKIDVPFEGKPLTKTAQIRMCGNSVSPFPAVAILRANVAGAIEEVVAA